MSQSAPYDSDAIYSASPAPERGPLRPTDETDINGLIEILWRNWFTIAAITAVTTALAILYLLIAQPTYSTQASLFVDPKLRPPISNEIVPDAYGTDLARVESQVAIIMSDSVLGRVVDKLRLDQDARYAPPRGSGGIGTKLRHLLGIQRPPSNPRTLAVQNLAKSIKVTRAQKSYVIDILVSAPSPVMAARIAEALIESYISDQTNVKSDEAKRINDLIDARLGKLREQVRKAEKKVDDFKQANKIVSSDGGIVTEQQLTRMNGELVTARGVAAEAKARHEQIVAALRSRAGSETLPDAIRSPLIQKLREQYAQASQREAALSSQLQSRHPVMIEARSRLNDMQAQINSELNRIASAAKAEYKIAQSRVKEISKQIEQAKAVVASSNTALIKVRELEQDAKADRALLDQYLMRAKETKEVQNVAIPDARMISPPTIPSRPSRPIGWLVLAVGVFSGLGLGVAWALISDQIDNSVRTTSDITAVTGLRTVLTVPEMEARPMFRRQKAATIPAAQYSDMLTAVVDRDHSTDRAYRQSILRFLNKIKSRQRPGRPHVVMLASAHRNAGNSAAALSVAYTAACAGERALLIDAASSDATLSDIFAHNLEDTGTISLGQKSHLERIIVRDERSGMAFLPIALADIRSLKTQLRRQLVAGLNSLIQDYDLVFIDAGALLEDESALSLTVLADQIMIVVRAGRTTADDISETLELVSATPDQISGAIMTFTDRG